MLAAIYDPYLDTMGGGERYTLTFGLALRKLGYEVDVFWDDASIKSRLTERFGLDLSALNFLPNIFKTRNSVGTGAYLSNYRIVFIVSDGSIPVMTGKKNLLHFQVPFQHVGGRRLLNRIKLKKVTQVICNSHFTKKFIDQEYGVNSTVLYPPVATHQFIAGKKQNLILSVGRFSGLMQQKRHEILASAFKNLVSGGLKGWSLCLAGGSEIGGSEIVHNLRKECHDFPIRIMENPKFDELQNLYSQARIFWFASGFGIDPNRAPHKVEHFGISVAEAMSAGVVPFVHPVGGVVEIVENEATGFYWSSPDELITKTLHLIKNPNKLKKISQSAANQVQKFSSAKFMQNVSKIISD